MNHVLQIMPSRYHVGMIENKEEGLRTKVLRLSFFVNAAGNAFVHRRIGVLTDGNSCDNIIKDDLVL